MEEADIAAAMTSMIVWWMVYALCEVFFVHLHVFPKVRAKFPEGACSVVPHGGVPPFHQKPACLTQLTLGPYVVQIWSRQTPEPGPSESLVLHRVEILDARRTMSCVSLSVAIPR